MITQLTVSPVEMMQIPADYYFSPWWVLGVMLFVMFVGGMVYGMGTVIGWKEFAQKIRLMIFSLRMKLDQ